MRTFISYAHEIPDRKFARWLFTELQREGPLTPVIDFHDLAFGPHWRESLPQLVGSCELLLFVRSRFSHSARYCRYELEAADAHGLMIGILDIDTDTPRYFYTEGYTSIDFTRGGNEAGLADLRSRIDRWQDPAVRAQVKSHRQRYADEQRIRGRSGTASGTVWEPQIYGHDRPREELRDLLGRKDPGIIVVSGPEGIGKTTVVRHELDALVEGHGPVVHYHVARPGSVLGAQVLASALSDPGHAAAADGIAADLEKMMEQIADLPPTVIVVDSLENLVNHRGPGLLDLELDEALERISRRRGHHAVKVVLVTRDIPHRPAGNSWLLEADHIRIDKGLGAADFGRLLRDLDRRLDFLPPSTPDEVVASACRLTYGRPRLAEFIVARASRDYSTIGEVVSELDGVDTGFIADLVFDEFLSSMDRPARTVLEALAALGTPVAEDLIRALATDPVVHSRLNGMLRWLVARNAVSTAAGLFYLQNADRDRVLAAIPIDDHGRGKARRPGRRSLLRSAGNLLWIRRVPEPQSVGDLDFGIAALNAYLTAGYYEEAAEFADALDKFLAGRSRSGVLLQQRLDLQGNLPRDFLELANDTAIGDIYLQNGRYREALPVLHRARLLALAQQEPRPRKQATVNIATSLLRVGRTGDALMLYRAAYETADKELAAAELITPLEGIANCHRVRGKFDLALQHLHRALDIAEGCQSPRALRVHLRLARWYAMINDLGRARHHLDEAAARPERRSDPQIASRYLDQLADHLLATGDAVAARIQATEAERIALNLGDPILVQRARTTLAFACLCAGGEENLREARRLALLAARDRPEREGLFILAIRGLTALQQRDRYAARADFALLLDEARARVERDPQDFAADGFLGYAICGRHFSAGEPLEPAAKAFARYARTAPRGLTSRLRLLVEAIEQGRKPGVLGTVARSLMDSPTIHPYDRR